MWVYIVNTIVYYMYKPRAFEWLYLLKYYILFLGIYNNNIYINSTRVPILVVGTFMVVVCLHNAPLTCSSQWIICPYTKRSRFSDNNNNI